MMAETSTYMDWLKRLPADDSELSACSCPECGTKGLSYQYFGFSESEFGWKLVWCDACKSGVRISRTKVPATAQPLIDDSAQQEFLDRHSDIRLIA
jgi:hypothetical protein